MRETKSIEFKAEVKHTFLKTVSAYSNYGTGIMLGSGDNHQKVSVGNSQF